MTRSTRGAPLDAYSQPAGFFDAAERIEQLRAMQNPVLRLHAAIDWELFGPTLEVQSHRPLHNFSDQVLERQIRKDLSFMSFLGITLAERVPDEKTLWEFCQKIGAEQGFCRLFR